MAQTGGGGSGGNVMNALQSQRDCVFQPRVARHELPWGTGHLNFNPNGVVSHFHAWAATPLGLLIYGPVSQGSSCLATLGFKPESRWDSKPAFPKALGSDLIRARSPKTQNTI
jgi:hypothetical protein